MIQTRRPSGWSLSLPWCTISSKLWINKWKDTLETNAIQYLLQSNTCYIPLASFLISSQHGPWGGKYCPTGPITNSLNTLRSLACWSFFFKSSRSTGGAPPNMIQTSRLGWLTKFLGITSVGVTRNHWYLRWFRRWKTNEMSPIVSVRAGDKSP